MPEPKPRKPAIVVAHIVAKAQAPNCAPALRLADLTALDQMYLYFND